MTENTVSHPRRDQDARGQTLLKNMPTPSEPVDVAAVRPSGAPARGKLDVAAVTDALRLAVRAPSIHNTQPWRFELRAGALALRADRSRQLGVADPDGHSLMISCGAALALTDLALRTAGWVIEVDRMPDSSDPDLLAELRETGQAEPRQRDLDLVAASQHRRSERRPFGAGPPSEDLIERLRDAAARPGVYAHFPSRADENLDLAIAVSAADRFQRKDPDYLAEMARWTQPDDAHPDGIPATAVVHLPADEPRHADVPVRDFEVGVPGAQLIEPGIDEHPLLAVIFTDSDTPSDRLQAGEAMMRLMLEAELAGLSSCPLSQSVDMLAFRVRLQTLMNWTAYPQMMLRLGAPPGGAPAPLTPRRPIDEVVTIL
jgi:nitroreductase